VRSVARISARRSKFFSQPMQMLVHTSTAKTYLVDHWHMYSDWACQHRTRHKTRTISRRLGSPKRGSRLNMLNCQGFFGGPLETRTPDPLIKSATESPMPA
jgi:hypothetical protein